MKVFGQLILVLWLSSFLSMQAHASEEITSEVYVNRAGAKIISGIANVATGWMELPKNISYWSAKNDSFIVGLPEGLLWGLYHVAARTGNGALDFITFWLPTFPSPEPVFVWENASKLSDYQALRMGR